MQIGVYIASPSLNFVFSGLHFQHFLRKYFFAATSGAKHENSMSQQPGIDIEEREKATRGPRQRL
jgi:hypothetical protein